MLDIGHPFTVLLKTFQGYCSRKVQFLRILSCRRHSELTLIAAYIVYIVNVYSYDILIHSLKSSSYLDMFQT